MQNKGLEEFGFTCTDARNMWRCSSMLGCSISSHRPSSVDVWDVFDARSMFRCPKHVRMFETCDDETPRVAACSNREAIRVDTLLFTFPKLPKLTFLFLCPSPRPCVRNVCRACIRCVRSGSASIYPSFVPVFALAPSSAVAALPLQSTPKANDELK